MVECLPSVNQVQSFVSRTNCLLFAYQRWIQDQPKIILRDVIFDSYISSSIKINRVSCRISSVRSSAIRKKNLYHDWVPIFDRNRLMITGNISVKLHSKVRPTLKLVYRQFERKEGERILYSKLSHSFRPFRFYFMGRNLERTWELSCSPTRKVTLARIY